MNKMDISKYTVNELKSLAYDTMMEIQLLNNNLTVVQREIQIKIEEEKKNIGDKNAA